MSVHLVNPSDNSFGTAVITPRWLFVLAAATPSSAGDPILIDESLEQVLPESIQPGDIVGISVHTGNALRGYEVGRIARERGAWVVYGGIHATLFPEEAFERGQAHAVVKGDGDIVGISVHTGNALRGYEVGRIARERGAWVIYGGIHATLFPEEAFERGQAHAVVKGDGDIAWGRAVTDILAGAPTQKIYEGGRIGGTEFLAARWDLMPRDKYMWASVQTIRGCPKHCSFCSVWRTDGQQPRQRAFQSVIDEIVNLRQIGFRFIALADDNFYPVTLTDLRLAKEQGNTAKFDELTAIRTELAAVFSTFNVQRHLTSRDTLRVLRDEAFRRWEAATAA